MQWRFPWPLAMLCGLHDGHNLQHARYLQNSKTCYLRGFKPKAPEYEVFGLVDVQGKLPYCLMVICDGCIYWRPSA